MYIYKIEKLTDSNKTIIQEFYKDHANDKYEVLNSFIDSNKIKYFIYAEEDDEIVGLIPVNKLKIGYDYGDIKENHYSYFYTVVHTNYRDKGICSGMLRMGVKLLINEGADRIRVAKSSLNDVPHSIFTDMEFKVIRYDPNEIEYKHTYELDISKADLNKLNDIWSDYTEQLSLDNKLNDI